MAWSFTIARVAGSEIRIHLTFLLLLAWIAATAFATGGTAAALNGVAFILAIFGCVVLHELGHAVAARRCGIATPDITLLPIGGVARLSRMPENPVQEIVVAIAGPLVNVVIALVVIAYLGARFDPTPVIANVGDSRPDFLVRLAWVNIFLVLFNLIPAFPMDGGRVLRAALAIWLGRRRATDIAVRIGQVVAFGFGLSGLLGGDVILVFIAIFVYLAAAAEGSHVSLMDASRRINIADAMTTRFETLGPKATLEDAGRLLVRTSQRDFPVLDHGGMLLGVLTRDLLVEALKEVGGHATVDAVMARDVPGVRPTQRLDAALQLLMESKLPFVAVLDASGHFVGYVGPENIGEVWLLEQAARRHAPTANG